jgi:2-(1,2-epoxy-1,2-dihydrophenyl)acetyl-CoA isomerase
VRQLRETTIGALALIHQEQEVLPGLELPATMADIVLGLVDRTTCSSALAALRSGRRAAERRRRRPMASETIRFEVRDGCAVLTLHRPDKLNAFNERMHAEVRGALDEVEGSGAVRALVLTGAGKGFCAGQDLGDRALGEGEDIDLGATLEANYNPLIRRLRRLPLPVIAAVNGVAAGAGANLALACDIVIAARSARFIQAFCKVGLIPDSGGTFLLPRLAGEARAKGMALLGEPIGAEQALAWGLIWAVVDDEALPDEANRLGAHLAAQPTRALALIKEALHAAAGNTLDAQLDLERDLQREAGRTADYREGVRAFLEKRPPAFRGR